MPRINWSNIGAEVVTDPLNITADVSSTEPAIVIPMSALASGGLDSAESMDEVEKVMLAIFRQIKTFTKAEANLNDSFMEIDDPTIGGTTQRANTIGITSNFRTLDYAVSFYKPDAITVEFDPDNLTLSTP